MPAEKTPLAPGLRQLELVVHRSPDFIWVSDVAGNPVFANEAALQLLGVTWDEMLQTPFANLSVPEEREFVKTVVLPAVLKDTRWEGELTFQNLKTGERIPVLGNVFRVDEEETGMPARFATITRDLREQKRREAELYDAQQRVTTVLVATEVGTWTYEIAPNRVVADANLSRLFGVSPEEAAGGRLESYLRAIHPDDRPRVEATIAAVIEEGADASGLVELVAGSTRDITESQNTLEALQRSEENFRTLAEERDELLAKRDALLASERAARSAAEHASLMKRISGHAFARASDPAECHLRVDPDLAAAGKKRWSVERLHFYRAAPTQGCSRGDRRRRATTATDTRLTAIVS
jgi:PAS domain S-box-containing protein